MDKNQERKRLNELFTELEQIAVSPSSETDPVQKKLDDLRSHMPELEKDIQNDQEVDCESSDDVHLQNRQPHLPRLMYEKEQVGFVYSDGNVKSLIDAADVSSDTENTFLSPLLTNGHAIGALQITPRPNRQLTEDQILLATAISQQASLQIENLRLLAASERSRAEAEAATRRFIHEGWDSYLDAIHQSQRVGFEYDQASVFPNTYDLETYGGVRAPLQVMNEQVGVLYIEPGPNRPLENVDKELIHSVAEQVAQQVENLRLLADASRARAEAEKTMRQTAHENWQNFTSAYEESGLGFVYDSLQVTQLDEPQSAMELDLVNPLTVQGEVIGQLGVTATREISREDVQLAATLASQVSIHLETLRLNAELEKRAQELQELDRLKSAFLANMSHELRTPLNSILGFTDVMLEGLDGDLTDFMNNDLRLIQKNGQHLLHLINDVLDMAKIESGRMNLHPETFNIYDLLGEVCSITSSLASERNTALFIEEDSEKDIKVYADDTRIRQVMINLVNNSIKFTENGKIAISLKNVDSASILITVKDTGIGIPPDKLESIFQEFTQVDSSTTRKVGGTGLGLPISRRLVEMHGGRLWAESTGVEGEGASFHVELPVEARISEVVEKQEK
jgi:signal transduction histidine kinase